MKRMIRCSFILLFLCFTYTISLSQQNLYENFPDSKRIVKVAVYPTISRILKEDYFLSFGYEVPLKSLNGKTSICHIGEFIRYSSPIYLSGSQTDKPGFRLTYRADLRYYVSKRKALEGFFVGLAPFIANEQLSSGGIKRSSLGVGLTLGYQKEIFKRFTLEVNPFFGLGASHYQRTLNNEEVRGIDERVFLGLSLNLGRILKVRE